jgi:ABC-type Mn2+/Zn2+ transport system permease subunit
MPDAAPVAASLDALFTAPFLASFAASIAMAIAAGVIGCFAVMRRMTLASDAISHVALPGIGVALALGIHPLFGAGAMLGFGALAIWALERRTRIATETIVGVVFSAALAAGSLLSTGEDLVDALFGGRGAVGAGELVFGVAAAIAIVGFVWRARSRLVLVLVSPDIATMAGIRVARLDLWFLEAFALTVALGLRYLGVLLMGSMIIIPAATAKRLARNLSGMFAWATGVAVASTVIGTLIALAGARPPGPVIVCCAAAMFLISLAVRR